MLCNLGGLSSSVKLVSNRSSGSLDARSQHGIVGRLVVYYRPGYPRRLVRQGDGRNIQVLAHNQLIQPLAQSVIPILRIPDHRPRTVDQQLPQVAVTPFTDAQQPVFAASAVLARREPQGGGKITPFTEGLAIPECTGKGTGGIIMIRYPAIKMAEVLSQSEQQCPKCVGQAVLRILKPLRLCLAQFVDADRCDNAVFADKPTNLVGLCRSLPHQFLPYPVGSLDILLLHRLDSNKPHSGSAHCFADSLGINAVLKFSPPIMPPVAG
jgi:hypothetical protein